MTDVFLGKGIDINVLLSPASSWSRICIYTFWPNKFSNQKLVLFNFLPLFNLFFISLVIQYSFTTVFVAAFPLAPLLAFINNLFEIRLDAIKMVKLQKRMVPKKANTIGKMQIKEISPPVRLVGLIHASKHQFYCDKIFFQCSCF